ncbi:glycosyltransferase [Mycobacterium phage Dylan]|uniref:Glycosyltransferase n=5 Tax=Viruses TaxID=10239 RepID=S5YF14_9CAUD|nr:glycosyltransferase [Mycobacterium phage Dylan]YP_009014397.1 glycosyltransferase [Mycobacterium phage Firecracker]AII28276.1 hypothetical protein PBI_YUNGJAMAL_37 [Mycobacterium phage YungJamal]ALA48877.1 hypothetical protein ZAKHE101_34 [Mycobacterium phage Zakhe101]QFP96527.1 glycosyltransferase [Mycobacterium phage Smooch]WUT94681.1 glycosyltransferase [Mycobacterium phage Suarez]AER47460.1 hypothetical protein FIRECRACKER_34 [Mycobacterium phage Firecracker]
MSDRPVTLFMFAGREGNMRCNLPLIRQILDENPNVQFDIWNLARKPADAEYLRTIQSGSGLRVINNFAGPRAYRFLNKVWSYYAQDKFKDQLFVKMDDDVVFIETEKFDAFVDEVEAHPEHVLSAEVVNNGACTEFVPGLNTKFRKMGIDLLDVHESNAYALMAHQHMERNWEKLVGRKTSVTDIETWLSINFIGMNWDVLRRLNGHIGNRAPEWIAGRQWLPHHRIGDEGAANMLPRAVMQGFTVGHLGFGPQKLTDAQEDEWREVYTKIGQKYLLDVRKPNTPGGGL